MLTPWQLFVRRSIRSAVSRSFMKKDRLRQSRDRRQFKGMEWGQGEIVSRFRFSAIVEKHWETGNAFVLRRDKSVAFRSFADATGSGKSCESLAQRGGFHAGGYPELLEEQWLVGSGQSLLDS